MMMDLKLVSSSGKYDAFGKYDTETKKMIVCKGSLVSDVLSDSRSFRGTETIKKLRLRYTKDRKVIEDVVFSSASTAANFITGVSTNGMVVWKNAEGEKLKTILFRMGR